MEDDVTGNYIVPACQIYLFCNDSHQMGSVSILSEARVIEVYGYRGEYLSTLKNELMEEVDGMSVFRGDLTLERPLKECCLKFLPLKSKESMWLYGIKVVVQQKARPETVSLFPASMPLKAVEERLQASGTQISDKAEALKKMMELFQGGASLFPSPMVHAGSTGLPSLPQSSPQQPLQSPNGFAELFHLLQGPPSPAVPVQQTSLLEPPRGISVNSTGSVNDQEELLTGLIKLLLDKSTRRLQPEIPLQPAATQKGTEQQPGDLGKGLLLELLEKSGVLNKQVATDLLTEIVEKSGATVRLNQSLGDAEQTSPLPLQGAAMKDEKLVAEQQSEQVLTNNVAPNSLQELPLAGPKPEPSREMASQTDVSAVEQFTVQTALQGTTSHVAGEDPNLFGRMFQGFQEQLLELLGHRFEELKLEVIERLDVKIQEMEERINGRFDAIIDALQGQEDEEEIFEQPDEGSV